MGGDTLEGRFLYHEPFMFKPTFKAWKETPYKRYLTLSCAALKSKPMQEQPTRRTPPEPSEPLYAPYLQTVLLLRLIARIPYVLIHEGDCRSWTRPGHCTCQPLVRRRSMLGQAWWSRN
jgi:hypothetical protein